MKRRTGPLDDFGGAKDLAVYRLSVAKEDLADAEHNFEEKRYRSANNRAYYAIFHAISACLALEFKAFKSHAQVIGNFNKDFVLSGKFPKELGGKISQAQEVRNASDYSDFYIISVQETEDQLQTARQVVALVEKYLQAQ